MTASEAAAIAHNVQLCRDAIVFFTACGGASGYGGHTGGAYDSMPEVCLLDAYFRARPDKFVTTFFDEAGHRSATQYLFSVLKGHMPAGRLMTYRVGHSGLAGHPELGRVPGIDFSSGRLGHMWPMVNGVARAEPSKVVCCLGSDGSQMEGNNAEAARLAAAQGLAVKLLIDDNDVTIAGHPSEYMGGYNVGVTMRGHGIATSDVDGEDLEALHLGMAAAITAPGPYALVIKRTMCPGMGGVEGTTQGHDAVSRSHAVDYLTTRGHAKAVEILQAVQTTKDPYSYIGAGSMGAPRQVFGSVVGDIIKAIPPQERSKRVVVIDSDLEGSCGLAKIRQAAPECYISGGIMERGNFSACAGFGFGGTAGTQRQAVFATFAAFQEMILSEVTMARLNFCNVLCHFSHSGVDDMSDNMCHFGQNNLFADNGLEDESTPPTHLYFPADVRQMTKVVQGIFWSKGLRFVYSTRSKVPEILRSDGTPFFGDDYHFTPGRDDMIVGEGEACDGYIVSYSDALYRALDAVTRLRSAGINVGLVNKCHVNAPDEAMMRTIGMSRYVMVVESQSTKTGLGIRLGTWLLERGYAPKFARVGTHTDGSGGTWEQAFAQGYDPESIMSRVRKLHEGVRAAHVEQRMIDGSAVAL